MAKGIFLHDSQNTHYPIDASDLKLKRLLPTSLRGKLRERGESARDWIDAFAFRLRLAAERRPLPRTIFYFGYAPGDDLLCSSVFRELRNRGQDGLVMVSNHRDLFIGNDDLAAVEPLWHRYSEDASTVAICQRFANVWGSEFKHLHYAPPMIGEDRSVSPKRHIIAELCASASVTGTVAIRPYFTLGLEEKKRAGWASGKVVIQSSGMAARHPMRNKQWIEARFQGVVDAFRGNLQFIQLGALSDPPLAGTHDFRGKTTIRESAAILANARLFIGTVGFLMHVSRAVDCPSVIIFGGREAPWQTGYICNANLYSDLQCAPCWRWNSCEYERKCMTDITVNQVVSSTVEMLDSPRETLLTEIG